MFFFQQIFVFIVLAFVSSENKSNSEEQSKKRVMSTTPLLQANHYGLISLYKETIDLNQLAPAGLKHLKVEESNLIWSARANNEPVFFQDLEFLELFVVQLNPKSFSFSTKLKKLNLLDVTIVNGSVSDLLKAATDLTELSIRSTSECNIDLGIDILLTETLRDLDIKECVFTWNSGKPLIFHNLDKIYMAYIEINPKSIVFTKQLQTFHIEKSKLINGTVSDILRSAVNLQKLSIIHLLAGCELVLDSIPVQRIKELEIKGNCVLKTRATMENNNESYSIPFQSLEKIEISETQINPHSLRFTDKLQTLRIDDSKLSNESISDILRSANKLTELIITNTDGCVIDMGVIPAIVYFDIKGDCVIKFNSETKVILQNLETLLILDSKIINPDAVVFKDKLRTINIQDSSFYNGTILDLLKTATSLNKLSISNVTEINKGYKIVTPTFLGNLEELTICDILINPLSINFSEKLDTLVIRRISRDTGTTGRMSDLVKTAKQLKTLEIGGIVDFDLASLPANSLENLKILEKSIVVATTEESILLQCLVNFRIEDSQINPFHISFSDKLKYMDTIRPEFVNGSIYDLMKTATNLHTLWVNITDLDISKLPQFETLSTLIVHSTEIHCSAQKIFPNMQIIRLKRIKNLSTSAFCNFNTSFPALELFDMLDSNPASSEFVLRLLETETRDLTFVFDLNPETKSYEYGVVVKFLLDNGFDGLPLEYFSRPNDFPDSRYQLINIFKGEGEFGNPVLSISTLNVYLPWKALDIERVEQTQPLRNKIIVFMYIVFLAVFLFIGIFGNAASICVLRGKKMRNSSGIILLSLAFYDLIVTLTYLANSVFNVKLFYEVFILPSIEYDISRDPDMYAPIKHNWISHKSWFQAYIIYPLNKTAYTGSVYSTVLISMERFIAICWPLKSRSLLSTQNSKRSVLLVLALSITLNLTRWIESYEWDFYSETSSTTWNEFYKPMLMRMEAYTSTYHGLTWTVMMYILPFVLVGILNFKLGQQIVRARRNRGALQNSFTVSQTNANEDDTSVTKMLLCVVAVFVTCNSIHIVIIFYYLVLYEQIELSTIEAISCLPLIVNSSVNFIIYLVMGKTLRGEFLKLIPNCIRSLF